ncbi:MAG: aldolase/citrate lyase family protein [Chloroflexi bacterium]|nr:aldolase/citrate lyase family protein [Chloroflexota bacterium]
MNLSFRSRLQNCEPLLGTIISIPSPEIAEILAEVGFDWLFIDLEHSKMGPGDASTLLEAVAGRVDCIIRVPLNDEIWIKKVLDTGATGVLIPRVNTMEEAQRAVRYCKYPPQGTRSVGMSRAHGYGAHFQEYIERANIDTVVIIQIEHIQAVENIEMILKVEGIDGILIGPYDLSASMNLMGQLNHPDVQSAVSHIRQACLDHKIPYGIFTINIANARTFIAEGYSLIAVGGDTSMLAQAAKSAVQTFHLQHRQ